MMIRDFSKLSMLAEGGEGMIYEYKGKAVKCYKSHVDLAKKQRKIKLLMSKILPPEVVCPIEEVLDKKKQFVGYVMEKVQGEEFRMLSNKKFVKANHVNTKEVLQMLVRMKEVIDTLHDQGIYVGDLNDQNILFDQNDQIYLIDCDSWNIGQERCQVAMDLFRDPLLVGDHFNEQTDLYAFCVLAFKALTRLHPFGGTMTPDLHILERMAQGISVIDRPSVRIPRTAKSWRNLSPKLLRALKAVFEDGVRSIGDEFSELSSNLKYCQTDQEYYYGKYTVCPLCNLDARVSVCPDFQGTVERVRLTAVLSQKDICTVLDLHTYLNQENQVVDLRSGQRAAFMSGTRYYFTDRQVLITEDQETFCIHGRELYLFEKKYKSRIIVEGDKVYYQNRQNALCEVTVLALGNSIRRICSCGNTAYFEISGGHYGVLNVYDGRLIFHTDGYNCEILHNKPVLAHGLHYDAVADAWLVVLGDSGGNFRTLVLHKKNILFDTEQLWYSCPPGNLCMYRHILFFPLDGKIRGYAFEKDQYKDFACDVVDGDSRLIRSGKRFTILNEENIYLFGA